MKITHNTPVVVADLAKAPQQVLAEVDRALGRGAIEVANEWKRRAPKYRSELTNSIQVQRAGPLQQVIESNKPQAVYTEKGTGPGGRPSLATMLDWIRLKRITPNRGSVRSLAFLLRRSIAQKGIKANPSAQPALDSKVSRLHALIVAGVESGLRKVSA